MIKGMEERTPGRDCTSCKRHSNCKSRFPSGASFSTVYADPHKSSKHKTNATPRREMNSSLDCSPTVSKVCNKTPAKRSAIKLPLSSQFSEESTSNCNTDSYSTPIQSTRLRQIYDHKRSPLVSLRGNDANSAISKVQLNSTRKSKLDQTNFGQKDVESQSKSMLRRGKLSSSESPNGRPSPKSAEKSGLCRPLPKSAEKGGLCSFCKSQPYTSESVCFIANDGRISAARTNSVLTRNYHQCSYCRCHFGAHNRAFSVSSPSNFSRRPASTISEPLSNKLSGWTKSSQSEPVSMKTSCDFSDDTRNCTCGISSKTALRSENPSKGMVNGSPPDYKDDMHEEVNQALPDLLSRDGNVLGGNMDSDKSDEIHLLHQYLEVENDYKNSEDVLQPINDQSKVELHQSLEIQNKVYQSCGDAQPPRDEHYLPEEACNLQIGNCLNQKMDKLDVSYADPAGLPTHLASKPLISEEQQELFERKNGENNTVQKSYIEPISPQQIQCERRLDFSECIILDDINVAKDGQHDSESFTHYEDNDEPCTSLSSPSSPHSNCLDQTNESCKIDFHNYGPPQSNIENLAAYNQDEGEINDFVKSLSYNVESYNGDNEYSCSEDGIDLTPRSLVDAMDFEHWSDTKTDSKEKMSGLARMRRRYLNSLREQAEMEKVMLKRQEIKARKQAEEWMLNCHMEEVLHKLAPNGEARVKVLIKAFETIMQYSDSESDSQTKDSTIPIGI